MPTSFDLNFQTFFIHSSLTFISFYFFTYTDFCLQTSSYGLLGRLYQSRNYRPWFGNVIEHVTYWMDVQSQFLITNLFFCTMLLGILFFFKRQFHSCQILMCVTEIWCAKTCFGDHIGVQTSLFVSVIKACHLEKVQSNLKNHKHQ